MNQPYERAPLRDLPDLAKVDYLARVNRAIDHVTRHLADPLRLEDVAKVACFSPFHFHRIFRAIVGETLHDFVARLRIDRALFLLAHADPPSFTEVALACGFGSSSDFSRCFRKRLGVSPRRFDLDRLRDERRRGLHSALGVHPPLLRLPTGDNPDGFAAAIRSLPARRVAYLRVLRPYEGGVTAAAARLVAWARERDLAGGQWLGFQWDDPEIVPPDRCRYDVGVVVPEGARLGADVHEVRFAPMHVAEVELVGSIDLELRALDWLYRTWLPESGYVPDHQPCFEAWAGEPFAHGDAHFELRLQLPIAARAAQLP